MEGFVGDEYVGFDSKPTDREDRRRLYAENYQAPLHEYEAFGADQAWMLYGRVDREEYLCMARATIEKVGPPYTPPRSDSRSGIADVGRPRNYGALANRLMGRSAASKTIKRLRGNNEAVASAYSLKNYTIAQDLGGEAAFQHLKQQAAAAGLRFQLASDMVPNHMAIDPIG